MTKSQWLIRNFIRVLREPETAVPVEKIRELRAHFGELPPVPAAPARQAKGARAAYRAPEDGKPFPPHPLH